MKELLERQKEDERKNVFIALGVTGLISGLLLVFSLFWLAVSGQIPEIDQPIWKTIAFLPAADYGTDNNGRKEVNNFERPSETPADRPKTQPTANNNANPEPVKSSPSPNHESNTNSEQSVNSSPTPSKDNTQSTNNNINSNPSENNTPKENNVSPTKANTGGSDDGNTNTLGNHGNPKAQVLNPNGSFEFGNGIGGPGGRMPVKTDLKGYNMQMEEKIRFDIIVAPSGEVIYCKAKYALHPELAAIGKENIMKWKFSEGEENLKTFVVVSFRLK